MPNALFQIKHIATGHVVEGLAFDCKTKAKEERERLNAAAGGVHYFVTPGPNHRKYRDGKATKTR